MRFGISATSGIFPKNLRTRLRPLNVWVWAIVAPCCLPGFVPAAAGSADRMCGQSKSANRCAVWPKRLKTRFLKAGSGPQERGSLLPFAPVGDRRAGRDMRPPAETRKVLLQVDLGAGCFELGLDLLGVRLVGAFLDRLGRALDQVLGFLEAEAGDGADFLDHVDLL